MSSGETYPCPNCGAPVPEMGMAHFSFNKPAGACPTCTGLGTVHEANLDQLVDHGAQHSWTARSWAGTIPTIKRNIGDPASRRAALWLHLRSRRCPSRSSATGAARSVVLRREQPPVPPALSRTSSRQRPSARGIFEGIVTNLLRRYAEHIHDPDYREKMEKLLLQRASAPTATARACGPKAAR